MKFFDKLFGKKTEIIPGELVFKSTSAALEYELITNPCRNPAEGDLVMGIVLHIHDRKDGVQPVGWADEGSPTTHRNGGE